MLLSFAPTHTGVPCGAEAIPDRLPATGYAVWLLAPSPPPTGTPYKKKKEKISRETSESPKDQQATARPQSSILGCMAPLHTVTPCHLTPGHNRSHQGR